MPPTPSHPRLNHPFVQGIRALSATCPLVTDRLSQLSDWLLQHVSVCVQVTLILVTNGPQTQTSDADNLGMPKSSQEVLSLSEKVKAHDLKSHLLRLLRYTTAERSPIYGIVKKEKEICASLLRERAHSHHFYYRILL